MKKIAFLLIVSVLFSSCYSYKMKVSANEIELGKRYKIETIHDEKIKGKVQEINDSIVVLRKRRGIAETPLSELEIIEKGKFSYLETAGLSIGILVLIATTFVLTLDFGVY